MLSRKSGGESIPGRGRASPKQKEKRLWSPNRLNLTHTHTALHLHLATHYSVGLLCVSELPRTKNGYIQFTAMRVDMNYSDLSSDSALVSLSHRTVEVFRPSANPNITPPTNKTWAASSKPEESFVDGYVFHAYSMAARIATLNIDQKRYTFHELKTHRSTMGYLVRHANSGS